VGSRDAQNTVIPAKAGIHVATSKNQWIPAFAGNDDAGDILRTFDARAGRERRIGADDCAAESAASPVARPIA
jgi:hypothetical protein